MQRVTVAVVVAMAVVAGSLAVVALEAQTTRSPEVALKAAQHQEEVQGDLRGALEEYKKLASSSDRAIAAKALLGMAGVYQKLDDPQARGSYERVLNQFADQTAQAAEARTRLAALGNPRVSGLVTERQILVTDKRLASGALTPDGDFLTFVDDLTDAPAILEMATGQIRRLASKSTGGQIYFPVLSPDKTQVAYAWLKDGTWELRIIANEIGATPRAVMTFGSEGDRARPRAWSPDGTSLVIELRRPDLTWQFAQLSLASGSVRGLKSTEWRRPNTGQPEWRTSLSPDGRFLAYAALATNPRTSQPTAADLEEKRIYILATDGSREAELTRSVGISENPVWTPDGSHVLFLSNWHGRFDLWAIAVSDGKPLGAPFVIKPNIGRVAPLGMSRGWTYHYELNSNNVFTVSFANLGGSAGQGAGFQEMEPLIGLFPIWSPDGRRIALKRPSPRAQNGNDLVVRTLRNGDEQRFAAGENQSMGISGQVWFHRSDAVLVSVDIGPHTGGYQIRSLYRADLTTREFKEVTTIGRFFSQAGLYFSLSPDDRTLYVRGSLLRDRPVGTARNPVLFDRIVAVDLDTGRQRLVYSVSEPNLIIGDIAVSPDGGTLAFQNAHPSLENGRISRVNVDGSGYRELVRTRGAPHWTSDGRAILFAEPGARRRIMRIPAEGGAPEAIGVTIETDWDFTVDPTSSRIAYPQIGGGRTLRALENLSSVLKARR
jgi:Tol biopolymer transport system component